jgi:hypothetical protein
VRRFSKPVVSATHPPIQNGPQRYYDLDLFSKPKGKNFYFILKMVRKRQMPKGLAAFKLFKNNQFFSLFVWFLLKFIINAP